jgi:hypothetical protein
MAAYDYGGGDVERTRNVEAVRALGDFDDERGSFYEDRANAGRDHEFNLDIWSPRGRETFGVRVDEESPSVIVNAGRAGQAAFSMSHWQRRDDEDSDGDSDEDSDRRGRISRDRRNRDEGWWGRDRDNGRVRRRDSGSAAVAYDYGYNDGYDHGLQDGRDRRNYDPARHRDYRSADRGYDGRLGSREEYRIVYRGGFRDGYDRGYRDGQDSSRSGRIRLPWPF